MAGDWRAGVSGPPLLIALLEQAVNRVLRLDRESLARLGELQGKVIRICFAQGERIASMSEIFVLPSSVGLKLSTRHDAEANITLRGTPFALLRLLRNGGRQELFASGELELSGDAELARRFQRIVENLDIDLEEQVSRVLGDVAAHKLGNLVRGTLDWQTRSVQTLGADVSEYLREESRILVSYARVNAFLDAVDVLRADADRLEVRLQRLRETA